MDSARTKSGRQVYRFDVWIETTADAAGAIKSVDYFFDHPSFETRHFPSEQPPKFLRFYEGWGCLEHVLLTVKFKDGTSGNLDFNQCNAL
jgi:hypothetical protein